jgi:hypothetical protein
MLLSILLYCRRAQKFDLDQREAGEIFGGGVNAFSRYENGKTTPPVALVKLLKLLTPSRTVRGSSTA